MRHRVIRFDEVTSTNLVVRQMADEGAEDGLTVIADLQTAGRGRLMRKWVSEKGENATFSVLVKGASDGLVFRAALAAAKTLSKLTGADIKVKWPNDIVLEGKKIAGILCESSISGGQVDYMIMGIGINLNTECFPQELPYAGSVLSETGKRLETENVVREFLSEFDDALSYNLSDVLKEITGISATVGHMVRAGETVGYAKRLDSDGSLIIENADGEQRVVVGDVSVRGLWGYTD